jgi:hypothetical protein
MCQSEMDLCDCGRNHRPAYSPPPLPPGWGVGVAFLKRKYCVLVIVLEGIDFVTKIDRPFKGEMSAKTNRGQN